jgi:TolB-like protein/Tfp pilus assembly protein PilF
MWRYSVFLRTLAVDEGLKNIMALFQELKRRNVIRVAAAYIITTWLLLQVADVVLNNIAAPEWVFKTIMLVLALGFPLAVLFAWAFEMTPEGIKKEKDVDRTQSITQVTGRKLDFAIITILMLALGYFAYDKFVLKSAGDRPDARSATALPQTAESGAAQVAADEKPADATAPAERSIAVLPFADMSPDKDQEYLSDGIAEELLNLLARIPELSVAARTSSFSFKGKDVKIDQVAEELNVAHVLEGSLRKSGNRVRITAQLIRADSGYHLWSETFDRTLDDVFAVQDEISAAVVEALKVELLGEAPHVRSVDADAYAHYLQGRYFYDRRTREDWAKAAAAFEKALEIEPDYASAWAGLSLVLYSQAGQSYRELHEGTELAREAAEKALTLDPNLAEGHAALGRIQASYDWDWTGADASFQRALELAPGNAVILGQAGVLKRFLGEFDEAIKMDRRAIALDPLSLSAYHALGLALIYAGQLDEALAVYDRLLSMHPEFASGHLSRSRILLIIGEPGEALEEARLETEPFWRDFGILMNLYALDRREEADALLETFIEENQGDSAYQIAQIYDARGDVDLAFEWLERAYVQRDGGLPEILNDPFLMKLTDDPRWPGILKKVGLYEAYLARNGDAR